MASMRFNGRHGTRAVRTLAILLLLALVIGRQAPAAGATGKNAPAGGSGPDLPVLIASPAEADAAGLGGVGIVAGRFIGLDEAAQAEANDTNRPPAMVAAALRTHGWQREYRATLARPATAGDRQSKQALGIVADLTEFRDATAAHACFAAAACDGLAASAGAAPTEVVTTDGTRLEFVAPPAKVGDETHQVLIATTPGSGSDPGAKLVSFRFRAGALAVTIDLAGPAGAPLSQDAAAKLAKAVARRIAAARHGQGPDLSGQTLRLVGLELPAANHGADVYSVRAGVRDARYGETAQQAKAAQGNVTELGVLAGFRSWRYLKGDKSAILEIDTSQFKDAGAASAFIAKSVAPANGNGVRDFAQLDRRQLPAVGDEIAGDTFTWTANGTISHAAEVYVRVGDRVAVISLYLPTGVPIAALGALATAQARCFAANGCAGPAPVPAGLAALVASAASRG